MTRRLRPSRIPRRIPRQSNKRHAAPDHHCPACGSTDLEVEHESIPIEEAAEILSRGCPDSLHTFGSVRIDGIPHEED